MSKQFWGFLAVLAVVFIGIIIFSGRNDPNKVSSAKPTNHVIGSTVSGVKLVEYGDYQCPACGAFYATTKAVQEKYNDQILFQFRNLPLTSLHPNAFAAARAAEAAGIQGKYFQMHDMLYENQNSWVSSQNPISFFTAYAKSLGLDTTKFKTDFDSIAVNNSINADLNAFDKTGEPKATPSFFLDGKPLSSDKLLGPDNQPNIDAFSKVIDSAIQSKKKSQP